MPHTDIDTFFLATLCATSIARTRTWQKEAIDENIQKGESYSLEIKDVTCTVSIFNNGITTISAHDFSSKETVASRSIINNRTNHTQKNISGCPEKMAHTPLAAETMWHPQ